MRINPVGQVYKHIPTGDIYVAVGMAKNLGEPLKHTGCCDFSWDNEKDKAILKRESDSDAVYWMIPVFDLLNEDVFEYLSSKNDFHFQKLTVVSSYGKDVYHYLGNILDEDRGDFNVDIVLPEQIVEDLEVQWRTTVENLNGGKVKIYNKVPYVTVVDSYGNDFDVDLTTVPVKVREQ